MKATKKQARACYDDYFGTLRCLNGGTKEENIRNSAHCRAELVPIVARAAELAASPSKLLAADAWLMRALTEDIPQNFAAFNARYPEAQPEPAASANVVPFEPTPVEDREITLANSEKTMESCARALFARVSNEADWRLPVNALAFGSLDEMELIGQAVIHFTGTLPKIVREESALPDTRAAFGDCFGYYRITATGYYAAERMARRVV